MFDFDTLMKVAVIVKRFKMFPVFDVAHYILTCLSVKDYTLSIHKSTLPKDAQIIFAQEHPLASWFGCLIMCFAGSFLGNFLLGEPLITPLQNTKEIAIVTIIWYLTNYCPFDVFSKISNFLPVKTVLNILKEIRRANKVDQGINFALKVMPDSIIIPLSFGILKGTAGNHMKVFQRLTCGVWQPSSIELLNPSLATKTCLIASVFFLLHKMAYLDFIQEPLLYLLITVFFLLIRLLYYFRIDPFIPVENLLGCLFTGGIMDSFRRAAASCGGPAYLTGPHSLLQSDSTSAGQQQPSAKDESAGGTKNQPSPKSKKED